MESTGRTRLQVNTVNERLGVVDIAHSKMPKTLRDQHVKDLSLVRHRTDLDLEGACYLLQRYVGCSLLILLELELSQTESTMTWLPTGGWGVTGHTCDWPPKVAAVPDG